MVLLLLLLFLCAPSALVAGAPRALEPGQHPNDRRLGPLKDLDGYFPFQPCATATEWARRAELVKRQMRVALGLWPTPTKTPLNAVVYGGIDGGTYVVEKVFFESAPGFFVTGNLYRPKDAQGKRPGVLCPHGHWDNGRFTDAGSEGVRRSIVAGAERFEDGGRSVLQSRCVQLARMGCVVFHYDMIGYADSQQISEDIAHRFAKQRPEMNTTENWGLFSPQAEAHLQSVMGLQTWNSIRALDFLLDLPFVDSDRIGVTGASGGGTQTFVLCALDSRPGVAFPAVMVSTAMQGGCTCENASLLRIDTGNVEFAALFAPKPLGMTAADDWTKEMPTKGFPELKKHYEMLGEPDHVSLKPLLHFGHNYNYVSRAVLYSWFNKHLNLGFKEPIVEEDYSRLSDGEMTVWNDAHPKPAGGPEVERKVLRWFHQDAQDQIRQAIQSDSALHQVISGGLDVIIGRNLSTCGSVEWKATTETDRGTFTEQVGLLRNANFGEEVPSVILKPKQTGNRTVVWTSAGGKADLFEPEGAGSAAKVKPEVQKLLDGGVTVVGVDLLYQGEFLLDNQPVAETRRVNNPREAGAYTFGYNRSLFAQRVHDLLTAFAYLKQLQPDAKLELAALDGTGPIAAAARAQAGQAIRCAAINTAGFRFGKLTDLQNINFLPGGAKYGDIPAMLGLGAPGKLCLLGESNEVPELTGELYKRAGHASEVKTAPNLTEDDRSAIIDWLLKS